PYTGPHLLRRCFGVGQGFCPVGRHEYSAPVPAQSRLAGDVRCRPAHRRRHTQEILRHGSRREGLDPGLPLSIPFGRLCREGRRTIPAGADRLESGHLRRAFTEPGGGRATARPNARPPPRSATRPAPPTSSSWRATGDDAGVGWVSAAATIRWDRAVSPRVTQLGEARMLGYARIGRSLRPRRRGRANPTYAVIAFAASSVFLSRQATVIGPTPPGTG